MSMSGHIQAKLKGMHCNKCQCQYLPLSQLYGITAYMLSTMPPFQHRCNSNNQHLVNNVAQSQPDPIWTHAKTVGQSDLRIGFDKYSNWNLKPERSLTVQHHSVGWNVKFWKSSERVQRSETSILIDYDISVTMNIVIYLYLLLEIVRFSHWYP